VAAGGFVLFALIANPILGMSRDWDVLTFAFALFSVVAVVRLAAAPLAPASFRRIAGALAITGFVHLGLWAALNRSPDLSRRRFERIATNERLFGAVWNAELWRDLGSASAQAGAYVPARDAFVQAIRRNPAEPMTYRLLAEIEYARGLHHSRKTGSPLQVSLRAALGDYYRMVLPIARKPSFVYLGAAYAGVQISGADSLVIDAFRNAVKEDPEDLEARAAWGDVLRNHGQIDEAEAEYAAVLAKQEGHVRAMMGMILVSGARGAPREEITRRVEDLRRRYPWSTCVQHMQNLLWQPRGLDGPQGFRGFLCFK
jgi:tetratricopeptide (TPR) repeat protein